MNHLQRRSFQMWWKVELFLAGFTLLCVATGEPAGIVCGCVAAATVAWLFHKDWKEARGHDDWY